MIAVLNKKALISGITGQDGSYLAELLLSKGYEVHGLWRHTSISNTKNIQHLIEDPEVFNKKFFLHYGDLSDTASIYNLVYDVHPNEIYNLGALAQVGISFKEVEYSLDVIGVAAGRFLEAIRCIDKSIKFYQASSSEMFGGSKKTPYNEETELAPRSPYAVGKCMAHLIVRNFREAYGIYACAGVLFNHESERRPTDFVTRKITDGVARIYHGLDNRLRLGNIEALRDWGYAPEYVNAAWTMMQQESPGDYAICTGEAHSVKEFVQEAFSLVNLNWEEYIQYGQNLRPLDVDIMVGDYSKAKKIFGYEPKVKFKELVKRMLDHDIKLVGENIQSMRALPVR